jgi:hypothetical protein
VVFGLSLLHVGRRVGVLHHQRLAHPRQRLEVRPDLDVHLRLFLFFRDLAYPGLGVSDEGPNRMVVSGYHTFCAPSHTELLFSYPWGSSTPGRR